MPKVLIYFSSIFILFLSAFSAFGDELAPNPTYGYSFPLQAKVKIDSGLLAKCMTLATVQNPDGYDFDRMQLQRAREINDFIDYLSARQGRRVDFSTGHEAELRSWVLDTALDSIDPVTIYKKSLELNEGNIFNAVLTIHQLLRNEARFFDHRRYAYDSTTNKSEVFFNHFIDIRGDLVERGPGFVGDHAGSWYRIWGSMLSELLWEPKLLFPNGKLSRKEGIARFASKPFVYLDPAYDEYSKYLNLTKEDNTGKLMLDWVGAQMGYGLMANLWGSRALTSRSLQSVSQSCQQRNYLLPVGAKPPNPRNPFIDGLKPVDLNSQMGPTLKQVDGNCYAYAFTAAVEAALYRKDKAVRTMSPDFLMARVLSQQPADIWRSLLSANGRGYGDGEYGAFWHRYDMFYYLALDLFTQGNYVPDVKFRGLYLAGLKTVDTESGVKRIETLLWPRMTGSILSFYSRIVSAARPSLIFEANLKQLHLQRLWRSGADPRESLLPILDQSLSSGTPLLTTFLLDNNIIQESTDGGVTWAPPVRPLISTPTWHAAVLSGIQKASNGETYFIFRNSAETGTLTLPHASFLRMRAEDAIENMTEAMRIVGPWDTEIEHK